MNTLKINIDSIPNPEVKEIVQIINDVAIKLNLDYYLIGARARDFWLEAINIPPHRYTLDIDFAVLVPDIDKFEEIKTLLINEHGFKKVEGVLHRVIYTQNDLLVDLLPFGDIDKSDYITLDDETTIISVIGFKEVYQQLIDDGYSEGEFKIATLPGLCVLKLIAWSDKQFERGKDIEDFAIIVENYFDLVQEEIYDLHPDLFTNDFDTTRAGARVLGRHIKRIIIRNDKLNNRIHKILSENVVDSENSLIGDIMARFLHNEIETSIALINDVLKGLND